MNIKWLISVTAGALLVTSAWAQTTQPLNLKLPSNLPASSASAAKPASSSSTAPAAGSTPVAGATAGSGAAPAKPAPGVYYGDTSGSTDAGIASAQACDDSKFNDPQVHGSVSTGVVSGSHMGTGTWEGGEVNVTKALGDCDHPTGSVGFSISVNQGQGNFGNYHNHGF
jgi:hypothetical protein